jgi:hypothetical protein
MRRPWHAATIARLVTATFTSGEGYTPKHEPGRCSIRGNCGKPNFFSPELPCVDNELAEEPADDVRKQLVEICGPKWNTGPLCCAGEQVCCPFVGATQMLTGCSSTRCPRTSKRRIRSYRPARPAKKTSTTCSAPLPALPISPSS